MITFARTDSSNRDFLSLVALLDAELAEIDGDEHAFYAQLNKTDNIKNCIVAYSDGVPVASGAFRPFTEGVVEIKRMYVVEALRRKGIAAGVLSELEKWAREIGHVKCVLETGHRQPDAIALYKKMGYERIPNYGKYAGVENSVCFSKQL